jgi:c-di-GMP-binding flagellar brake protein YcgR
MVNFGWNIRRVVRVFFESQAAVRVHRSSKNAVQLKTKTLSSKLMDLSVGGCALESAVLLPIGSKIYVFLDRNFLRGPDYKTKKRQVSRIVGIVKNFRQLKNRKYRLGVQFERVSAEDQRLIHGFVTRHERRDEKRISFPT